MSLTNALAGHVINAFPYPLMRHAFRAAVAGARACATFCFWSTSLPTIALKIVCSNWRHRFADVARGLSQITYVASVAAAATGSVSHERVSQLVARREKNWRNRQTLAGAVAALLLQLLPSCGPLQVACAPSTCRRKHNRTCHHSQSF